MDFHIEQDHHFLNGPNVYSMTHKPGSYELYNLFLT